MTPISQRCVHYTYYVNYASTEYKKNQQKRSLGWNVSESEDLKETSQSTDLLSFALRSNNASDSRPSFFAALSCTVGKSALTG